MFKVVSGIKNLIKKLALRIPKLKSLVQQRDELLETIEEATKQIETERCEYVRSLYRDLLDREAEESEVKSFLDSGDSPLQLRQNCLDSQEYQDKRNQYVRSLYRDLLGREAGESEVKNCFDSGYSPLKLWEIFLNSQEYQDKRKQQEAERYEHVTYLYRYLFDRKAEESEVKSWVDSKNSLLQLWKIFVDSQAFQDKRKQQEAESYEYVTYLYRYLLEREAEESEVKSWVESKNSPLQLWKIFLDSQAYQDKRKQQEAERYEYVTLLYRHLLDKEAEESEVKSWIDSDYSPLQLWKNFLDSQEYQNKKEQREINLSSILGGADCALMGEQKLLAASSVLKWYKSAAESLIQQIAQPKCLEIKSSSNPRENSLDLPFSVTIVTSLYKGEKYINSFVENIIAQTIFAQCQLFIVDANSPQKEYEIIQNYLELYPNIRYLSLDERIGIYEAWNLAIKESDSEFITNANVDDLHRHDALELKVKALRENPEVDVAYSDVYYSFLENLPFEIVEKCNLKTNLPTANKFNLLNFNSPHNSPIWRRSLHQKIGYFDPTYKSAGDYEFWLRAAFSGSYFLKIPETLIVYYYNPQGMSTKEQTPSIVEAMKIRTIYQNLLDLK